MAKMGVVVICLSLFLMMVTIRAVIVQDTDNEYVKSSGRYFIIDKEALDEKGTTLGASHGPQTRAHTCPRVAVLPYDDSSSNYRVPVTFFRPGVGTIISEGDNISIKFEVNKWPCPKRNPIWTINHESVIHESDVGFGGTFYKDLTTFKIEKEGDGYKFTHYNTKTKETNVVGLINDRELGYRRLVLSSNGKPFVFVLENVETALKRSSILRMLPFYT